MTLAIGYQLPGNPSLGSPSDHLIVRFVESESAGGSGLGPARPSVLVVDDDPSITSFLRRGLRLEGFEVQVASSGSDGLRLALETHFDLIVMRVPLVFCSPIATKEEMLRDKVRSGIASKRTAPADRTRLQDQLMMTTVAMRPMSGSIQIHPN